LNILKYIHVLLREDVLLRSVIPLALQALL